MYCKHLLALCLIFATVNAVQDLTQYFGMTRPYVYNNGVPQPPLPGCNVSGVYYVSRHGSRYPSDRCLGDMQALVAFVKTQHVSDEYKWVAEWQPRFQMTEALSELGSRDLQAIGARFSHHFHGLLFPYATHAIHTQCTGIPRTAQTAAAFTLGVVANGTRWVRRPWVAVSETTTNDRLLRFYDACPRYIRRVSLNTSATSERTAFLKATMPTVAQKVAQKTNLSASGLVSQGMLPLMWETCTFEQTVLGSSRWCSLFDEDDAKLFAYAEDLYKYYRTGYGIPVSYQNAAPLLQDIFKYFDAVVAGTPQTPRAKLMFGHAETVLPLKALLGLHKDATLLTATWTKEQREARKWRNSEICTMATNVGFVVSKCSSGEHQVQMLESETPVDFPNVAGCKNNCDALAGLLAALFTISSLTSLIKSLATQDVIGSIVAFFRGLWYTSVSIESQSEPELFRCVDEYIGELVESKALVPKNLAAVLHRPKDTEELIQANRIPDVIYTIGEGTVDMSMPEGKVVIEKWAANRGENDFGAKTIKLSAPKRGTVHEFIVEAQRRFYGKTDGKLLIYTNDPGSSWGNPWHIQTTRNERREDSYALSEPQDMILGEIALWRERRAAHPDDPRYPRSLSFLLTGPPGTGKTSFIELVASRAKMDVFCLTLSGLGDYAFKCAISTVPPGTLLLLEEVDAAFGKREEEGGVTMSAFLNFLDGVGTPSDCLIFMTTNHVDKVDSRVYRAARSQRVEFPACSPKGARGLFSMYFRSDAEEHADDFGCAAAELIAEVPRLCNSNLWALFTSFKTPVESVAEIRRVLASSDRCAQWLPAAEPTRSISPGNSSAADSPSIESSSSNSVSVQATSS
eukprot:m51a1_g6772 hypothetical protein (856) ;mRNA; r:113360-118075